MTSFVFILIYSIFPRTRSRCYHGNKSAATFKKGIFVHPPECLTACKIWRGVENFHFPRCLILTETCSWKPLHLDPFHSQISLIIVLTQCFLFNSYDVVWESLVLDQVIIPVIDIFLYSHPLYAWYCTDLWGETLSWSLAIKGLAAVFILFTLLYILFLLFWQGEFVQNQAIPNLVLMFDKREIL